MINIPEIDQQILEYLDDGNALYLQRLSKYHCNIINDIPRLAYYIKRSIYPLPKSFTTNQHFLTTNKIVCNSIDYFYEQASIHSDYEFLLWIMAIDEKQYIAQSMCKNPDLLVKLIKDNRIHMNELNVLCIFFIVHEYPHMHELHSVFEQYSKEMSFAIQSYYPNMTIVKELDSKILSQLKYFSYALAIGDIEVIEYMITRYEDEYKKQLHNELESARTTFYNTGNKSHTFSSFVLDYIIPKNVNPILINARTWIRQIIEHPYTFSDAIRYFINEQNNFNDYTFNGNIDVDHLAFAAEKCNLHALQYLYTNNCELDLVYETLCSRNNKCIEIIKWLLSVKHPVDRKDCKYTNIAFCYLMPDVVKWLIDNGFAYDIGSNVYANVFNTMFSYCHMHKEIISIINLIHKYTSYRPDINVQMLCDRTNTLKQIHTDQIIQCLIDGGHRVFGFVPFTPKELQLC